MAWTRLFWLPGALIACTGESPEEEPTLDPLPVSQACLLPEGATPEENADPTYAVEGTGVIRAVGETGACSDRTAWIEGEGPSADSQWLTIDAEDGAVWILSLTNPALPDLADQVGLPVALAWRSVLESHHAELALSTASLDLYLGTSDALTSLAPPLEVTFAAGAIEAEYDDACGHHARRLLSARRDGEVADIPTGETARLDGITIWSGGVVEDIATTCADAGDAYAAVVEWGVP